MKWLLGVVLGGVAMFAWGALCHMALPFGKEGLRRIAPDKEAQVVATLQGVMNESAIYFFPGKDLERKASEDETKAWEQKVQAGPTGLVIYNPGPGTLFGAKPMLTELLTNILACLMIGFALLHVGPSVGYWQRVRVATAFGLFAALAIEASYWNWYSFPTDYTVAQFAMGIGDAFCAGLVLAKFCRS